MYTPLFQWLRYCARNLNNRLVVILAHFVVSLRGATEGMADRGQWKADPLEKGGGSGYCTKVGWKTAAISILIHLP